METYLENKSYCPGQEDQHLKYRLYHLGTLSGFDLRLTSRLLLKALVVPSKQSIRLSPVSIHTLSGADPENVHLLLPSLHPPALNITENKKGKRSYQFKLA